MSLLFQCPTCNKEIITYPSRIKSGHGKYCSRKCIPKIERIIICVKCNKQKIYYSNNLCKC
ncbi:MAG: hypothetical protein AABY22_12625 [Nanoarchaeota archaeon]